MTLKPTIIDDTRPTIIDEATVMIVDVTKQQKIIYGTILKEIGCTQPKIIDDTKFAMRDDFKKK